MPRHCGLDPQSRGVVLGGPSYWLQGSIHRAGCQQPNPTSPHRHSRLGGNPQGGRATRASKTTQTESPSPLMGEESKVRVKTTHHHRHVIADLIRNPEGRCWVAVILASRQYPNGGATASPKQPINSSLPRREKNQSLSQCLTLESEGENDAQNGHNPENL